MSRKKESELILKNVNKLIKAATDTAVSGSKNSTTARLDELTKQYDKVHLKMFKRSDQTGKMSMWVEMPGQRVEDLEKVGLDSLCQQQGGSGEYEVELRSNDGKKYRFTDIHIGGTISFPVAKLQQDTQFGGMGPQFGNLAGLPNAQPQQVGPNSFAVPNLVEYMREQSQQSQYYGQRNQDTMMQQQQFQQMQLQAAAKESRDMMMMFFGMDKQRQTQDASPNAEVTALNARLERMEADRKSDERYNELSRKFDEQKNLMMMEALKANKDGDSSKSDMMLAFLGQQSQMAQANSNQNMALLTKFMDKPGEDEKFANLMGVMSGVAQNQMAMIGQVAQMAIPGGEDNTVRDAILQAIEGLTQLGVAAFQAKAAKAQQPPPQQVPQTMVLPNQDAGAVQAGQMAGMPQPQQMGPGQQPEPEPEEDIPYLTEEELGKLERDTAIGKAVAMVLNGEPIKEVTARLFAHARSNNDVAARWLAYPDEIGGQILQWFDTPPDRIAELAEDIVAFMHFLDEEGDPNEWSAETGYQPIKKSTPQKKQVSVATGGDAPELGVRQGEPTPADLQALGADVEEYDSSKPPQAQQTASQVPPAAEGTETPVDAATGIPKDAAALNTGVVEVDTGGGNGKPAAAPVAAPSENLEELPSGAENLNEGVTVTD